MDISYKPERVRETGAEIPGPQILLKDTPGTGRAIGGCEDPSQGEKGTHARLASDADSV